MEHKRNEVIRIERKKQAGMRLWALIANYKYLLLLALAGVVILLLPPFGEKRGQDTPLSTEASGYSLLQTRQEMEEILGQIDGVGRVRVMLTVASGGERIYQGNREVSYSGPASAPEDYESVTETVLLNRGSGQQEALQTQELYPAYVGALVVCDGAGNAATVLKVKEAVSVLTGLGTDSISVVKRSES